MRGKIETPMGEISLFVDDIEIEYTTIKGKKSEVLFPDVLGRYLIKVNYVPDGKFHEIKCTFPNVESVSHYPETGEGLECQAFYNKDSFKLSIGLRGDIDPDVNNDYDVEYLSNGMKYIVLPKTKTQEYEFGVCWIDNVDSNEYTEVTNDRDTQTWFGADPTIFTEESNHD